MTVIVVSLLLIAVVSLIAMGVFMALDVGMLVDLFAFLGLLASGVGITVLVAAFILNIMWGNW